MKIFISYRRDDSIVHARLIHNELAARFGAGDVFMDIDDIDYGDDFARKIDERLDASDVVVAVIGPHWAEMLQQRLRSDDYVRHELSRALARGLRVVPVLVDKASPPGDGLPADLAALRTLNALNLDQRALKPHLNALVETVQGRSFEDVAAQLQRRIRSQRRAQWTGAGVGLAAFMAGWVALLDFVGLDTRLASATMWLARSSAAAPWSGEVVLVTIDESTLRTVGRPFDASWRREHAQLVRRLASAGARTVAFDLFFQRPGEAADDAALEAAVRAAHPMAVVFGVGQTEGGRPSLLPALAEAGAGGVACAGQRLGYARSMPLAVRRGALVFPSLALAAYSSGGKIEAFDAAGGSLRVRLVRDEQSPDVVFSVVETARAAQADCEAIHRGDEVALQLFDPDRLPALRDAPRRIPYERLLGAGDAAALAAMKDKIVLVGLELADSDLLVLPRGGNRWGMELIAEQIDALVRGEAIRPLRPWPSLAVMLALGLAGAFARRALGGRAAWLRGGVALAGVLGCVAAAVLLYRTQHVLLNLSYLLVAFLAAWWVMAWLEKRGAR
ncbi:MAG TPA: CHASE2 domain-containing protein [Albitalea sp.]|nr:CHASE2 domain-containing protein [Albitalea sp.]